MLTSPGICMSSRRYSPQSVESRITVNICGTTLCKFRVDFLTCFVLQLLKYRNAYIGGLRIFLEGGVTLGTRASKASEH